MEGVTLSRNREEDNTDNDKCIICLKVNDYPATSSENGRKRICEAAEIRRDVVNKRLKTIGDNKFVYHMNNECYKNYTHKKSLTKVAADHLSQVSSTESSPLSTRLASRDAACRPPPSQKVDIYKHLCIICNQIKTKGICEKFRLCELPRAKKFLEATVFFQDEVYTRTCDIQDVSSIFGADLYCHKVCIRNYLTKFDRTQGTEVESSTNIKKTAWEKVASDVKLGFERGQGFELSKLRDSIIAIIGPEGTITNKEVKLLLISTFGENISFSYPSLKNRSLMCFSKSCTSEDMAETIRSIDPIKVCADRIRKALLEIDFDLEDRFCDSKDLEMAWKNVSIPDPLLSFFATLFGFDKADYQDVSMQKGEGNEEDHDTAQKVGGNSGGKSGLSTSKCMRIQALFQIMYYNLHYGKKRTPMHIMNSQVIHETCKSATLIKSFNRLGLCSSYDEVQRVQNALANFTVERSITRVPFPTHFDEQNFTVAAFDNFDHNEATLSGIGSCHDTVTVLFQEECDSQQRKPKISETEVLYGNRSFNRKLECQDLLEYYKPAKHPDLPKEYDVSAEAPAAKTHLLEQTRVKDFAWSLARMDMREGGDDSHVSTNPQQQIMPSWSASNSVWTSEDLPVMQVAFLPVIPFPVTEHQTVYTAMKNLQDVNSHLQQSHLVVYCDEGVYRIAREIQLGRQEEFKDLVLCLGSFHMAKVVLRCLGKYLKGSGAENIWIESGMFGVNVTESVLNGTNYVRSVKGMQLLGESLRRLQWVEFFKHHDKEDYHGLMEIVSQLKEDVSEKKQEASQAKLTKFINESSSLVEDFQNFLDSNNARSETHKYWDTFLNLLTLLNNLIRADREGNWELHLQTVQDVLPLFAVMDATNYLRWCSIYLEDMRKLPSTAPEIHQRLMQGSFVVKRTAGRFKAVGVDMSLEQTINRSQKNTAGIIGSTRKKNFVAKWEMVYHEMLAISNLHRHLTGINSKAYELSVNHEFSKPQTASEEKLIQAIITFIESNENPFLASNSEDQLHNILTKEIMTPEIREQILQVQEKGLQLYKQFREDRFVKKELRLHDTIHRTNLKTCAHLRSSKNDYLKSTAKKKRESTSHQRVVDIARARGTAIEQLLQFDVTPMPSLFTEDGMVRTSTKSALLRELEKSTVDSVLNHIPMLKEMPMHTTYIVDMMANIRKLKTATLSDFGAFCNAAINFIQNSARHADRIDFVFDEYREESIKDSERARRRGSSSIDLSMINGNTPIPVEMKTFWASNSNKRHLQALLHNEIVSNALEQQSLTQKVVSHIPGTQSSPCISVFQGELTHLQELHVDAEEADCRIVPHAMHATIGGTKRVIVLSSDTDVTVILLFYWQRLKAHGLTELWVKTGVGDSTRFVALHELAASLSRDVCEVLPAVHSLTGCDYTSKVGSKKAAIECNPIYYLKSFGTITGGLSLEGQICKAEEYLVQVLKRNTACKTMDELRIWMYHHRKGRSLVELPPTSHATRAHILRAFFATSVMTTLLDHQPSVLNPRVYGFVVEDDLLVPDLGLHPIPEEYAICCTCGKCATVRCICRKNGLPCCAFCNCQSTSADDASCKNPSGCMH